MKFGSAALVAALTVATVSNNNVDAMVTMGLPPPVAKGMYKQSSFMPTSYKPSNGSGMPSYVSGMDASPAASSPWEAAPPVYHEPTLHSQPPQAVSLSQQEISSFSAGPPTGAGMASYADALGGGKGYVKQSNFWPSSYKMSSGSAPATATSYEAPATNGASPAAGFSNAMNGSAPMKKSSYWPSSYRESKGSGMASYIHDMGSSSATSAPAATSYEAPTTNGASPAGFSNTMSGSAPMKKSSYWPSSYRESKGSGMASYIHDMGSSPAATSAPAATSSYDAPASTGASPAGFSNMMSGSAPMKKSSYWPSSYRESKGSGMASYIHDMGSSSAASASAPAASYDAPVTTAASPAGFSNAMSGSAPMKKSSYWPSSYRESKGSGMASYIHDMGSSPAATSAPAAATYDAPAATGASPAGFSNAMSGTAPMKKSSYWPSSYRESKGSGMASYIHDMGSSSASSAPVAATYDAPAATGASPAGFSNAMNGSTPMKKSSYWPSSYRESKGSGMASYIHDMGSSSASSAPVAATYDAPAANGASPAGFSNMMSGSAPMKKSSYWPSSYRESKGSGMASYIHDMGSSSASSAPAAVSYDAPTTNGASPAGFSNAMNGSTPMKKSSYWPSSYRESKGSGMASYIHDMGSSSASSAPAAVSYDAPTTNGASPAGFSNAMNGSTPMKKSSYWPSSYRESKGSGMASYIHDMGSSSATSAPAAVSYDAPTTNGASSAGFSNTMNGSAQVKKSSYWPSSYRESKGSGMASYIHDMGSSSASSAPAFSYDTGSAANGSPAPPATPMYFQKKSSYMPTSYNPSKGSGMPSYFDVFQQSG